MLHKSHDEGCGCEYNKQQLLQLVATVSPVLDGNIPVAEGLPLIESAEQIAAKNALDSKALPY